MYIDLRERNTDAFRVRSELGLLQSIPLGLEVFGALDPAKALDRDGAVPEPRNMHVQVLVRQKARTIPIDFLHDFLCSADVGVIADPHRDVQPSLRHHGGVDDSRIGERAVGHCQHTVVNGRDRRVHQPCTVPSPKEVIT